MLERDPARDRRHRGVLPRPAVPAIPGQRQDTGSGVFTLAGAAMILALGAAARDPSRHVARLALITAAAALLIDIYTY